MTTLRFLIILLLVLNALAFSALSGWLGRAPTTGEAGRITTQLNPERIRLASEAAPPPQAMTTQPPAAPLPEPAQASAPALLDSPGSPAAGADEGTTGTPTTTEDAPAPDSTEAPPQTEGDGAAAPTMASTTTATPDDTRNIPSGVVAEAGPPAAAADTKPPVCQAWTNLTADQADRLSQRLRRIGATPIRTRTETPDSWWVRIPPQRTRDDAERRVVELNLLGVTDTFIVQESGPTQHAVSLGVFKTENRARVLLGQLRTRGVTNAGIEPRMTTTYRIQASFQADALRTIESAATGLRNRRQACPAR